MIYYNMRYRGPYEYEKFILNILQFSNEVTDFINDTESDKNYETIRLLQDEINILFNESIGHNGLGEQIYKKFIMFKEAK